MKENKKNTTIISIENLDIRLNQVIDYIKFKHKIKTNAEISNVIEFGRTNLSAALNGTEKYLTEGLVDKFCQAFPELNKTWLLTGEGGMLNIIHTPKDDFFSHLPEPEPSAKEEDVYKKLEELRKKRNSNPEPSSRIINNDDLVDAIEYVVPWPGQAGMASKFYPEEMIEKLEKTIVKVKPEYRGVFHRIEVNGNSMPPKIQTGDWLRCEEISSLFWLEKNFFKKDNIYCIWHNARGIIFKRLIYKELGEIWCSSDNEDKVEFPDFPLEIEKVNKILIVRALVDRKF